MAPLPHCIFTAEMVFKMLVLGFFMHEWIGPKPEAHEGGYFRNCSNLNWWNILDFTVVVTSLPQLLGQSSVL